MIALRWLVSLACLLLPLPGLAGVRVQRQGAATLEIRFEPERPHITLSDTITATLTIEGPPGLKLTPPSDLPATSRWLLVERGKAVRTALEPQRLRWQQVYRCAPREPGTSVPFLFPEVLLRDGEQAAQTLRWEPVEFTVSTQITQPDRAVLRDITGVEDLPVPVATEPVSWPWWLLAALTLLLLGSIFFVRRYRRRRVPPRTALERALYQWQRLDALKLPEQGRSERFITLLTLLLRDYLEQALHLRARRQTTAEFLANPRQPELTDEDRHLLGAFFQRAEVIKFAHEEMTVVECHQWAEQVRALLVRHEKTGGTHAGVQAAQNSEEIPIKKIGQTG